MQLNHTRKGHDKLVRLLQYTCKFILTCRKDSSWMEQLENTLKLSRKLLRFGTCIEALYASAKSMHHRDPIIRLTAAFSHIANSMFLFCDHLLVLHTSKLMRVDEDRWSRVSNKCWLYSIILQLVGDIYQLDKLLELYQLRRTNQECPILSLQGVIEAYNPFFSYLIQHHKSLIINLLRNLLNLSLPLVALGYMKNRCIISLCGVVSSYLALLPLLHNKALN